MPHGKTSQLLSLAKLDAESIAQKIRAFVKGENHGKEKIGRSAR